MAPRPPQSAPAAPRVWLVDGFNLLHSALLGGEDRSGWWREAARRRVLDAAAQFDDPEAEIWVVFDGARPAEEAELGRVRVVFAPSADDWLVARVRAEAGGQDGGPPRVAVVTADRQVAGRSRHRGAEVVAPQTFLSRCTPG